MDKELKSGEMAHALALLNEWLQLRIKVGTIDSTTTTAKEYTTKLKLIEQQLSDLLDVHGKVYDSDGNETSVNTSPQLMDSGSATWLFEIMRKLGLDKNNFDLPYGYKENMY